MKSVDSDVPPKKWTPNCCFGSTEATVRSPRIATRQRRKYTTDVKSEAVKLADQLGPSKAARQLVISKANLPNWKEEIDGAKPSLASAAMVAEMKRLRAEVAELKKVNQVLKAAAAFSRKIISTKI